MAKNLYLWLLIAAVLLFSVQILAVVIYIYSFIPFSAFWLDPFFKGVEPTRDALFYIVFVVTNIVLMAMSVKWVLPGLDNSDTRRKFKLWLGLESVWCFLMVFCFFKWTTYRYPFWNILPYENPSWLQPFFCVVCALAALSKIFFPEIEKFYSQQKYLLSLKTYEILQYQPEVFYATAIEILKQDANSRATQYLVTLLVPKTCYSARYAIPRWIGQRPLH